MNWKTMNKRDQEEYLKGFVEGEIEAIKDLYKYGELQDYLDLSSDIYITENRNHDIVNVTIIRDYSVSGVYVKIDLKTKTISATKEHTNVWKYIKEERIIKALISEATWMK